MHILVWGGRGRGCTKWAKFGLKKIFCNFENNFQLLINLVLRIGLPILRTTFRNSSWYKCVTNISFFSLFSSFKPLKINFKIAKYFFKVNFSQLSTKCTWHDLLLFILHYNLKYCMIQLKLKFTPFFIFKDSHAYLTKG